MKINELTERAEELGLSGDEDAELVHDWDNRPESTEEEPLTYCEEWDVTSETGEHLGCLYDDGEGYMFAPGYSAGNLDYGKEALLEEGCGYKVIRRGCGCVDRLRFAHYAEERRAEMGRLSWMSICRHCDGGVEGDHPFDIRNERVCVAHRSDDE